MLRAVRGMWRRCCVRSTDDEAQRVERAVRVVEAKFGLREPTLFAHVRQFMLHGTFMGMFGLTRMWPCVSTESDAYHAGETFVSALVSLAACPAFFFDTLGIPIRAMGALFSPLKLVARVLDFARVVTVSVYLGWMFEDNYALHSHRFFTSSLAVVANETLSGRLALPGAIAALAIVALVYVSPSRGDVSHLNVALECEIVVWFAPKVMRAIGVLPAHTEFAPRPFKKTAFLRNMGVIIALMHFQMVARDAHSRDTIIRYRHDRLSSAWKRFQHDKYAQ